MSWVKVEQERARVILVTPDIFSPSPPRLLHFLYYFHTSPLYLYQTIQIDRFIYEESWRINANIFM